jgi:hypothetical protein
MSNWDDLTNSRAAKVVNKQKKFAELRDRFAQSNKVLYELIFGEFWDDPDFTPQQIIDEVLGLPLTISLFTDGTAMKNAVNSGKPGTITIVAPGDIKLDPITGMPRMVYQLTITGPENTAVTITKDGISQNISIDSSKNITQELVEGTYTVECSCEGYEPSVTRNTLLLRRNTIISSELKLIPPPPPPEPDPSPEQIPDSDPNTNQSEESIN